MKRVCTVCGRVEESGNLWCQEADCPAEDNPFLFAYGDVLGDVEIVRPLKVMRSYTLYEARRDEDEVIAKVAHRGTEDRLRHEANILSQLQGGKVANKYDGLPTLLPAYGPSDVGTHPHAKALVAEQEHTYAIFDYVDGSFLREELIKNPQPWIDHVGWMIQSTAEALAVMHKKLKRLHLMLSPDIIMIRRDLEDIPRPVLMDLGMLIQETNPESLRWLHQYGLPAYTAPELTYIKDENIRDCEPATPATDVYGLGLLLYEMLMGLSVHSDKNRRDDEVREAVRTHRPKPMTRPDLPDSIKATVEKAISRRPEERHQSVVELGRDLRSQFGRVPSERKETSTRRRVYIGLTAASLAFSLIILMLALFTGG